MSFENMFDCSTWSAVTCKLCFNVILLSCKTFSITQVPNTHTHVRHFEQCVHTQTHLLYYECLAHTRTWYLNCAHYSNCCLQFANIFMLRRSSRHGKVRKAFATPPLDALAVTVSNHCESVKCWMGLFRGSQGNTSIDAHASSSYSYIYIYI